MSGLPVFILPPACPFSNTREIHLLACYKAAYRTRRQYMHNRQVTQYKRRPLCCRLWLFVSLPTERSAVMSQEKYIGMDVHQATISGAVTESPGKLIMGRI